MNKSLIILIVVVVVILVAILVTSPTCKNVVSGVFKGPQPKPLAAPKQGNFSVPERRKPNKAVPKKPQAVPAKAAPGPDSKSNTDNPVFPPHQRGVVQPQSGFSGFDHKGNTDNPVFPPHQRGVVQPQSGLDQLDPLQNVDIPVFPPKQKDVVQPQSSFPVLSGNLYNLLDAKVDVKANFGISEEQLNVMAKKYKETHLDVPKPEVIRNRYITRSGMEKAEAVLLQSFINSAGSGQRPDTEQLVVDVMRDKIHSEQKSKKSKVTSRKSSKR